MLSHDIFQQLEALEASQLVSDVLQTTEVGTDRPPMPNSIAVYDSNDAALDQDLTLKNVKAQCQGCGSDRTTNYGGSTRGTKYRFMCDDCGWRWTQNRVWDPLLGWDIKESKFAIEGETKRSDGYKCGVCGMKKRENGQPHICSGEPPPAPPSLPPLASTSTPLPMPSAAVPDVIQTAKEALLASSVVMAIAATDPPVAPAVVASPAPAVPAPVAPVMASVVASEPSVPNVTAPEPELIEQLEVGAANVEASSPVDAMSDAADAAAALTHMSQETDEAAPTESPGAAEADTEEDEAVDEAKTVAVGAEEATADCVTPAKDKATDGTLSPQTIVTDSPFRAPLLSTPFATLTATQALMGSKPAAAPPTPTAEPAEESPAVDEDSDCVIDDKATSEGDSDLSEFTARNVFKALVLTTYRVKGDGSCWLYAVLATICMCEHAATTGENTPSLLDRARDAFCRQKVKAWLLKYAKTLELSKEEVADIHKLDTMPKYPLRSRSDFGSFGGTTALLGLAAFFKVSIVMWNKTMTGRNSYKMKQQVIAYCATTGSVSERLMTPKEILAFDVQHPRKVAHIEWNGVDHYAALRGPQSVLVSDKMKQRLQNVQPVALGKRALTDDPQWRTLSDKFTLNDDIYTVIPTSFKSTDDIAKMKQACLQSKCNAFLIIHEQDAVKLVKFTTNLPPGAQVPTADFTSSLYIHVPSENKLPKLAKKRIHRGCTCGRMFSDPTVDIDCIKCGRWCHVGCTDLCDADDATLEKAEYVCSECA